MRDQELTGQLKVTLWLCALSVLDSFDTRWFAAIEATSAAVRMTVWGWSDVPRMSRLSAPAGRQLGGGDHGRRARGSSR